MTDTHKATLVVAEPREAARQPMHPLVAAAMQGGQLDAATMERFLDMQERWEASEARKAFTRAMAALKRDLPTVIAKDQLVDYTSKSGHRTRYTHTSLAAAMEAITEPLYRHGFSLSWKSETGDRGVVRVTAELTHVEGHVERTTLEAPPDTSGNKNPAQSVASTITLLQRYTALTLLGIATADMQEPRPAEQSRDAVDARRNMAAVRALAKEGIDKAAAESHVGRPVSEWTLADLDELRGLLEARRAEAES